MEYLIYILIGWGITDILVNGSILDRVRVYFLVKFPLLSKLLTCIRCSGFWVGILMGVVLSLTQGELKLLNVLGSGFLISGSSVIINALMIYLLTRNFKNNREPLDEQ
jgi:hypothetical protein